MQQGLIARSQSSGLQDLKSLRVSALSSSDAAQAVRLPEGGLLLGELLDLHLHRHTADLHTLGRDAESQAQLEQALRVRALVVWFRGRTWPAAAIAEARDHCASGQAPHGMAQGVLSSLSSQQPLCGSSWPSIQCSLHHKAELHWSALGCG